MTSTKITSLAFALTGLLSFGGIAQAQSLHHIDSLAVTAERQARRVLFQTYGLSHIGPAATLKHDAARLVRLASHIHQVAHVDQYHGYGHYWSRADRLAHINGDVRELDRLMHHMQDTVRRLKVQCANRVPRHTIHSPHNVHVSVGRHFSLNVGTNGYRYGHPGHGQFIHPGFHGGYGSRTLVTLRQIEAGLASLEITVHHLLHDTGIRCSRLR